MPTTFLVWNLMVPHFIILVDYPACYRAISCSWQYMISYKIRIWHPVTHNNDRLAKRILQLHFATWLTLIWKLFRVQYCYTKRVDKTITEYKSKIHSSQQSPMKRKSVKNPLLLAMDTYSASLRPSWSEVAKRGLKEAISQPRWGRKPGNKHCRSNTKT